MASLLVLDKNIFLVINSHHNLFFDAIFYTISLLGEGALIWLAISVYLLVKDRQHGKAVFLLVMAALLVTVLLDDIIIRGYFFRARPYLAIEGVRQMGKQWSNSSFPSDHVASSLAAATVLGWYYRKWLIWLAIFVALMAYSRIYSGMHYPSDVLAGIVCGLVSGATVVLIDQKYLVNN